MGKVLVIKDADFSANSVDKIVPPVPSIKNLINPAECEQNKYVNNNGTISLAGDNNYAVTGFIPVNGINISVTGQNGFDVGNTHVRAYATYDANKSFLRSVMLFDDTDNNVGGKYVYAEGDVYVRFTLFGTNGPQPHPNQYPDYPTYYACYGDKLLDYKPYEE